MRTLPGCLVGVVCFAPYSNQAKFLWWTPGAVKQKFCKGQGVCPLVLTKTSIVIQHFASASGTNFVLRTAQSAVLNTKFGFSSAQSAVRSIDKNYRHGHPALTRVPLAISALSTEREGFEPSLGLTLNLISSQAHSTALPPLQVGSSLLYRQTRQVGQRQAENGANSATEREIQFPESTELLHPVQQQRF